MKLVTSIREGLRSIEGALKPFPPEPGYEGVEEAIQSAQTIWSGENHNPLPLGTAAYESDRSQDDADDDGFGMDGGGRSFDPVFEIGADVDERFPGLGGEEGRRIDKSVRLHGIDALGWYVSFHHPGVQWGVYVPISGIVYLVKRAFGGLSAPLATTIHLAFHAILNHELFHFATDYAVAQSELAYQEPWYVPAKKAFRAASPDYCVEEEQLANAYMLSAFRSMKPALRVKGKQAALRNFVARQPTGYCDALDVRRPDWDRLLDNLARRYGSHAQRSAGHPLLWRPSLGYDWSAQFPISPRIDWRHCPIHLVDDSSRLGIPHDWLSFFARLSAIVETAEFRGKLESLALPIRRAWDRTKQKLGVAITAGADFKKWERGGNDLYSVRVNDNFRAHLRHRKGTDDWLAIDIGSHREMGHG